MRLPDSDCPIVQSCMQFPTAWQCKQTAVRHDFAAFVDLVVGVFIGLFVDHPVFIAYRFLELFLPVLYPRD